MANHIVLAEPRETAYRLPESHRQAILSQAQTNLAGTADLTRSMREIEKQRQQFIEMYGDPFGSDSDN
ncbi:hypothetical protein [Paraburkholderia sp.]|uniref:hypothetical protein n=1 Tax=Paraburkholderia sp. TaxID=1926495 RepID=UPI0026009957|nr:hypothetical protein [Paraburkholderia sp.]